VTIGDRETLDGGRNTVAHSFRQLLVDLREWRTCNLFVPIRALETSADYLRATSVDSATRTRICEMLKSAKIAPANDTRHHQMLLGHVSAAAAKFDVATMVDKYEKFYRDILAGAGDVAMHKDGDRN
jgi:hypothetical protein